MVTAEGTFPKVDSDPKYASEINKAFRESYQITNHIVGTTQARNITTRFFVPTLMTTSTVKIYLYLENVSIETVQHSHGTHVHQLKICISSGCITTTIPSNCSGQCNWRDDYVNTTTVGSGNTPLTVGYPNGVVVYINGTDRTNAVFGSATLGNGTADVTQEAKDITDYITENAVNTIQLQTTTGATIGSGFILINCE